MSPELKQRAALMGCGHAVCGHAAVSVTHAGDPVAPRVRSARLDLARTLYVNEPAVIRRLRDANEQRHLLSISLYAHSQVQGTCDRAIHGRCDRPMYIAV